jgi:ribosomal protein L39E
MGVLKRSLKTLLRKKKLERKKKETVSICAWVALRYHPNHTDIVSVMVV